MQGSYPLPETNFQDFFRTQIDLGSKIHINAPTLPSSQS